MNFAKSEQASSLVELAVILPVLLLIVSSLVDYAFFLQKAIQVQDAASSAAALGAIPGNSANTAAMVQLANYDATGSYSGGPGFNANATSFYTCTPGGAHVPATTTCSTGAPLHYVQVTTSLTATAVLPFPGTPSTQTLTGAATYRIEVMP
jgi:Flp pilus assembly protein TadG